MCRLATEENTTQSQTYNQPFVEVKGAVPQLPWIKGAWIWGGRKEEVDVKKHGWKSGDGVAQPYFDANSNFNTLVYKLM